MAVEVDDPSDTTPLLSPSASSNTEFMEDDPVGIQPGIQINRLRKVSCQLCQQMVTEIVKGSDDVLGVEAWRVAFQK